MSDDDFEYSLEQETPAHRCPTCGAPMQGRSCPACAEAALRRAAQGERRPKSTNPAAASPSTPPTPTAPPARGAAAGTASGADSESWHESGRTAKYEDAAEEASRWGGDSGEMEPEKTGLPPKYLGAVLGALVLTAVLSMVLSAPTTLLRVLAGAAAVAGVVCWFLGAGAIKRELPGESSRLGLLHLKRMLTSDPELVDLPMSPAVDKLIWGVMLVFIGLAVFAVSFLVALARPGVGV